MGARKKMSLPVQILIGMGSGVIIGILLHALCGPELIREQLWVRFFEIGGNLFLNLFRMIVIPVVLVSMILGIAAMNDPKLLGRVGIKTLVWFALTTIFASITGLFFSTICGIGKGVTIALPNAPVVKLSGTIHSFSEQIAELVPENVFQSFVEANMIQIILIAVICGFVIAKIRDKVQSLFTLLTECDRLNVGIVNLIQQIAPFGVFCLMAHTFSLFGVAVLIPLGKYILCFLFVSALELGVVYPLILWGYARVSPWIFYRKMAPVMLMAFSTSSSNAVLPSNIETATKNIGVNKSISTFILSLGATINMNGTAIMQGCAVVLIAQLYNVQLTTMQLVQVVWMSLIASVGTAGMPSAGVLMLGLVLQSVGLPLSGIGLVLGVDRIVDMFRTVVNITGDTVTAVAVGKSEGFLSLRLFNDLGKNSPKA